MSLELDINYQSLGKWYVFKFRGDYYACVRYRLFADQVATPEADGVRVFNPRESEIKDDLVRYHRLNDDQIKNLGDNLNRIPEVF